jgi:hypothetical protein
MLAGAADLTTCLRLLVLSPARRAAEKATVVLGKLLHYGLLVLVPGVRYGLAAALTGAASYRCASARLWAHCGARCMPADLAPCPAPRSPTRVRTCAAPSCAV